MHSSSFVSLFHDKQIPIASIIDPSINRKKMLPIDLTANNKDLSHLDLSNTKDFTAYIFGLIKKAGAAVGYGGYGEDRIIYKRSNHFQGEAPRSIHLGIDLWMMAGSPVFCPLEATVHSFADNIGFGNYGPTIILEHQLENNTFFTLYGHLSRKYLKNLKKGKSIKAGKKIAELGIEEENGNWPPHLHFQIITDMLGLEGDFPGVSSVEDREKYLDICPDPDVLLRINS